jgi:hypothetical protein
LKTYREPGAAGFRKKLNKASEGKEGIWILTAKGQQYYMLFRFYGAEIRF